MGYELYPAKGQKVRVVHTVTMQASEPMNWVNVPDEVGVQEPFMRYFWRELALKTIKLGRVLTQEEVEQVRSVVFSSQKTSGDQEKQMKAVADVVSAIKDLPRTLALAALSEGLGYAERHLREGA